MIQVNPVHALIALLKQQAYADKIEIPASFRGDSLTKILVEAEGTQFRLAALEKLVENRFAVNEVSEISIGRIERASGPNKFTPTAPASGRSTDAINQAETQTHGRAWYNEEKLWNDDAGSDISFRVVRSNGECQSSYPGIAQKFTPSVEDIAEALFREDVQPMRFAQTFLERSNIVEGPTADPLLPRLLAFCIAALILALFFHMVL